MKTMTYLLNLTLLVVCSQFVFADNVNSDGKQIYISYEDAQAALSDKDTYDEGALRKENPPGGGGETSRDCTIDDSSSDAYVDTFRIASSLLNNNSIHFLNYGTNNISKK